MWTTSSFRADSHKRIGLLLLMAVCMAAGVHAQEAAQALPTVAPDAPRPARPQPKERQLATNYEVKRPVELRSVKVGRLTKSMQTLAGAYFLKTAKDPFFIEVKTVRGALGKPALAAAPVIVLNGERLLNTRGLDANTLVAFVPDSTRIKGTNSVAVVWIGKQEPTMTKKPLTFRSADIK